MSLDEPANPRHAAMLENPDHPGWALILDRPARRHPRNYGDELAAYKELLDEKIIGLRDALTVAEAERAALDLVDVDFDPDPGFRERPAGVDARLFDLGADVNEQIRENEDVISRRVIDVNTGGRT